MDILHLVKAAFLGLLEGGTEFIPVSSTGHLIVIGHLLGFQNEGRLFEVVIQLGAILAIVMLYFKRLLGVVLCLHTDAWARNFVLTVILAFIPAALLGVTIHKFIKALFDKPAYVCIALILGGFVLLWVDRQKFEVKEDNAFRLTPMTALKIGLFQCFALFPGVSRSGSTIVGAMLMGVNKKAAAEFSFFLSMPTMLGATVFDLYKNKSSMTMDSTLAILVGFTFAFISGWFVVKWVLNYLTNHGFALFGYWRIVTGTVGLVTLWLIG
jgi:undecaprenyl-diphosphatase